MDMDTGTVGVIVPVRGDAPFLSEALGSILSQQPPPADVVVVDDASPEPVSLPEDIRPVCRLVRRSARGGPAGARQTGLETLNTDLVALCDSDDAWEPGKLGRQLHALQEHPAASLCFGRARVVGPAGRETGERWEDIPEGPYRLEDLLPLMYDSDPFPTSSVLVRRASLRVAGGFLSDMPDMAEDWDLWLRLLANGATFVCEPDAVVRYRRHDSGLTADLEKLARGSIEVHERHARLVSADVREAALARDYTTLARGRIRRRDYGGARAALREAATHGTPRARERVLRLVLCVPGLRAGLGRRRPYGAAR
jgi:glycosyltransferase involved in cell wall biosynthesis